MISELKSIKIWLNNAECVTATICIYKQCGAYPYVVFNLQQAEELISKATLALMNFSMISDNSKSTSTLGFVLPLLGINIVKVKGYGHNWRKEFLKQLKKINNNSIFKGFLPQDISKKGNILIDTASRTKNIPNPKPEEIEQFISSCNYILDIADKNNLNDLLDFSNNSGGLAVDQKKLAKGLVKSSLFENDEEVNKTFLEILKIAIALIFLAALDVYLSPHFDARYFPDTKEKVQLDEKFPLVIKSDELTTILKRCINLDKEYLPDKE